MGVALPIYIPGGIHKLFSIECMELMHRAVDYC